MAASSGDKKFYLRYYVGHEGSFGHEFMQFVFHPDGRLRYENSSNYKGPTWIQKEAYVSEAVLAEARRIVEDSEITLEDGEFRLRGGAVAAWRACSRATVPILPAFLGCSVYGLITSHATPICLL